MSTDPEVDATLPSDRPGAAADQPDEPGRLATLGETLESSHERFVARIRERQRKGEIE